MAYRPLGWVKYHKRFPSLSGNEYNPNSIQTPLTMEQAFEAGADAMLKALLDSPDSYAPDSLILKRKLKNQEFGKGRLVFIPENY